MRTDPNNTASVLTVNYWNGGAWTAISETDGTETGGNTAFAQDGSVTWTVPAAWARASLVAIGDTALKASWSMQPLYWTRWEVSATTEATWAILQMRSLNRSTAYAELLEGQVFECGLAGDLVACVEALTDAGTANVVVNAGVLDGSVTGKRERFT